MIPPAVRYELCGVPVDILDLETLTDSMVRLSGGTQLQHVCYVNAHVHNLAAKDHRLRDFMRSAAVCYADGASIVWACRQFGITLPGRMTAADFLPDVLRAFTDQQRRVFFLGGQPGVAERAARSLSDAIAGFAPVGTHSGYFEAHDESDVVNQIIQARPDVLLVGMGTPRQERWIAEHQAILGVPLIWSVGALLDYSARVEPRCPVWMGQSGLEWLYRLAKNPRKMAVRYLWGNPRFVSRVLWSKFRGRMSKVEMSASTGEAPETRQSIPEDEIHYG